MDEREQFWSEWFAKRDAFESQIESQLNTILREGYNMVGEITPERLEFFHEQEKTNCIFQHIGYHRS